MDESGQLDPSADPQLQHPLDSTDSDQGTEYARLSSRTTIPPRPPAAAGASLPERFGRYRVGRCLGQGAMGAVYLAEDTQLDRPVALKIPKFTDAGDGELIERFYREARAAATLRHPNLCPVYDAGEIEGTHYLSMAYIEGRPLSDVLEEQRRPAPRDAAVLLLKLAKAIDAAHSAGVIHRDLKPANILIDAHHEPIVMDFGLARRMNKEDSRLTQSGLLMGSPAYMSPEQVEGDSAKMGPACDVYSLGIIFYELLTGKVPFQGSIAAVMGQVVTATPKKPSAIWSDVDKALEVICLKMIAKRPEDRFASMHDVVAALEAYLAGRPIGVAIPEYHVAAEPTTAAAGKQSPHGIVIAPWMLITAIAVIIAGFGVTWHLIATVMQQKSTDEITFDAPTQKKLASGEAKLWLDGEALTDEQLEHPFVLSGGKHTLEAREKGVVQGAPRSIDSDPEDPTILEKNQDGTIASKSRQRHVAEWVVSQGGKVKLGDATESIASVEAFPEGKLRISEIDLTDVASIPQDELKEIQNLTVSLKRLVLPKTGVNQKQVKELRKALEPTCKVEQAS